VLFRGHMAAPSKQVWDSNSVIWIVRLFIFISIQISGDSLTAYSMRVRILHMKKYLVPDTNVFLHFPPIADIDWLSISGSEEATILIAPVVLKELNRHKDAPTNYKLRDRATKVLKELHARFKTSKPKEMRTGVQIEFLQQEPLVDFAKHRLSRDLADDWLIATTLQFKVDNPDAHVAIVTADVGLEIKATIHVEVIQMPENLRIPDDLDAQEKKIKELERQLRTIQSASPSLGVKFGSGTAFSEFTFYDAPTPPANWKASEIEKARREYPLQPLTSASSFALAAMGNVSINRYNANVEKYYSDLSRYCDGIEEAAEWFGTTAEISLLLQNEGGAPANDIDIFIHFPGEFEVLMAEQIKKLRKAPEPPGSLEDATRQLFAMPHIDIGAFHRNDFPSPSAPQNARLVSIKKTNSYDAHFHVERLKHQSEHKLPLLYFHFTQPAKSFRADYHIVAANVPSRVDGILDFIYKPK
jgi:PIN domain